jgi:molybdopterin/thiamine biosynthesis adenylyltransferase
MQDPKGDFGPDGFFDEAYRRNRGLVTQGEQDRLRHARVGVAGLGGMGGIHVLTLARMGVGQFHLADLDHFSLVNINRQAGADAGTVGRPKVEVMAERALAVNPFLGIERFPEGIQDSTVDAFLSGVDVVADGLDFFATEPRRLLYRRARAAGIPIVFTAPLGFSATLHVFTPEGMSFEDYFDIREGMSKFHQLIAFAVGLAPRPTHLRYMDLGAVDLADEAGPSLASACQVGAGMLATEVVALLLGRRPPEPTPVYVQFDPYRRIYRRGRLRWGNRGPLQRLKRWVLARRFRARAEELENQ